MFVEYVSGKYKKWKEYLCSLYEKSENVSKWAWKI